MLVYQATKSDFMLDVERGAIVERITSAFRERLHRPNRDEVRSWESSMQFMYMALNAPEIPGSCGVAIEFRVPYTSSRIDFLLSGRSDTADAAVIIELKGWKGLEAIPGQDAIVRTYVGHGHRNVSHPSYQAWSYAKMIEDYNESVREANVTLRPCAYLHNYRAAPDPSADPLFDPAYAEYLELAPAFCAQDTQRLRDFICRAIRHGDDGAVLYEIESGRLRPSKSLQDALASMLEGCAEFVMIDDQKVVFEQAMHLAREARRTGQPHVMIVRGGPGTGKSVVAVNLLARLTAEGLVAQYISKNSAPRRVYAKLLQRAKRSAAFIGNLFRGPDRFFEYAGEPFDALIVDEAHRLRARSGVYGNLGENQIAELIASARFTVFFIDETQRVTFADIGTAAGIRDLAERAGAGVSEAELFSQFRCNGSNNYLDWLDDVLGIRPAEDPVTDLDFDFRVFDDPNELFTEIEARDAGANKARVVAGYCWHWPMESRGDRASHDIVLPAHGFARSWNLDTTETWAIDPDSVAEVGCVHTSQGLEFEYVGVIIGDDMRFSEGAIITDRTRRARTDQSLKGLGAIAKTDPARADRIADEIIRNTYRVLMTRGMRGCYVFCTDPALAEHFRASAPRTVYRPAADTYDIAAEDPLED